jgi:hypothetical protein
MPDGDTQWVQTVGAPTPDDPRDGELHQFSGALPERFYLEAWSEDESGDGADEQPAAHYVRSASPPRTDADGRTIWLYEYQPE